MSRKNESDASRLTEEQLCAWLGSAAPGDKLCYHRGFLALDRCPIASSLSGRDRRELCRLGQRALLTAEGGLARLVQHRHGPGDFSYLLVSRQRSAALRGGLPPIFE